MKRAIAILLLVASCNTTDACWFRVRQRPVVQRPVIQRPIVNQQTAPQVVCIDGKCYKK